MNPVPYSRLAYLERRVLRILLAHPQGISDMELDVKADLDGSARPQADALVLHGLGARHGRYYYPTDAGAQCVAEHTPTKTRRPAQAIHAF